MFYRKKIGNIKPIRPPVRWDHRLIHLVNTCSIYTLAAMMKTHINKWMKFVYVYMGDIRNIKRFHNGIVPYFVSHVIIQMIICGSCALKYQICQNNDQINMMNYCIPN